MKILELDLIKYGPFTGRKLIFPEKIGTHVLLGPNEAGKSSALRALRALLYGVEERTADSFIHGNIDLRIGGRIKCNDSGEFEFMRKKGRKNTVLSLDGTAIPDEVLAKFLGGVTQEQFARMFGIGYQELVDGGADILSGKGDTGKLLFAAGIGGNGLQEALGLFDARSSELFKPQAKKLRINVLLGEYRDIKTRIKALSLSAASWEKLLGEKNKAEKDVERLNASIRELSATKNKHERLLRVLPIVAERTSTLSRLEEYADVPELPDEFGNERAKAMTRLEASQEQRSITEPAILDLKANIAEIHIPDGLLACEFDITQVNKELGGIAKAAKDMPIRMAELAASRVKARELLDDIRPGHPLERAGELRKRPEEKAIINSLAEEYIILDGDIERNGKSLRETRIENERTNKLLGGAKPKRDNGVLKKSVAGAQRYLVYEESLNKTQRNIEKLGADLTRELDRLTLWDGTLDALLRTPFPSVETCEHHESSLAEIASEVKRLNSAIAEAEDEKSVLERELRQLVSGGAIPTLEELGDSRVRRDAGWSIVKRSWRGGENVEEEAKEFDPDNDLSSAYEACVRKADDLSDKLRSEAARVTSQAQLLLRIDDKKDESKRLGEELAAALAESGSAELAWRMAWNESGITPLSPKEMQAWLFSLDRIKGLSDRVAEQKTEEAALKDSLHGVREKLSQALRGIGEGEARPDESFGSLVDRCQGIVELTDSDNSSRGELESQAVESAEKLDNLESESRALAESMAQWRTEWSKAVYHIGLDENSIPSSAMAVLSRIEDLNKELNDARRLEDRITAMQKDAADFGTKVSSIVTKVAPDLAEFPAEKAAEALVERLGKARNDSVRLGELKKQLGEKQEALSTSEAVIRQMDEKLASLCRQARCESQDDLIKVERRSGEHRQLKAELANLEKQLLESGEGRSLDEMTKAAQATDPDETKAAISDIETQLSSLSAERSEKDRRIGELRKELENMDSGPTAADEAEKAASTLAALRSDVDQYVRYTMASLVLKREIERYRQANQDPLLLTAGEIFAKITCGSFSGLAQEIGDDDKPVILGRRNNGKLVGVEGMSDGTRDQLYLSLRLASLMRYMEKNEPMPFVVDDILIKFDDMRALATLDILADISKSTQVIFFTHHSRLADLAGGLGRQNMVSVQEF